MKWNLRMAAAQRGYWKASDLQRALGERGLVISAGKLSGLWSGTPVSLRLDDLDVICAVLGCAIGDLLTPEPEKVPAAADATPNTRSAATGAGKLTVVPRRRDGRTLPPK